MNDNNEENKFLDINFSYTDEFGQISTLHKTIDSSILDSYTPFDILVDQFKSFLIGAGFDEMDVNKITINE